MSYFKNLSEELAKQFRLPDHLVERETGRVTATEIRLSIAEAQERAKERRKRTMPFARRFVVEAASVYGLDLAVYIGWYDGDFMYDGQYIPTIGLDGVEE